MTPNSATALHAPIINRALPIHLGTMPPKLTIVDVVDVTPLHLLTPETVSCSKMIPQEGEFCRSSPMYDQRDPNLEFPL
jgi:hypothetical protein